MDSGIYAIQHVTTDQVYVGSTIKFDHRWRQHRNALNRGGHPNKYLQNAWDKHGEASFKFYVLEKVPPEKELLEKKEAMWIAATRSSEKPFGYNLQNFTTRRGGPKGYKHTPEALKKISAASKRQPRRTGEDAPGAKLTPKKVQQIRTMYALGMGSHKQLGDYYGVKKQTISAILNWESWADIPDEQVDVSSIKLPEKKVLKGSEIGISKLTNEDVLRIRSLKAAGTKQRDIAAEYKLSETHVSEIVRRLSWTHI